MAGTRRASDRHGRTACWWGRDQASCTGSGEYLHTYEGAARRFFDKWVRSLRWQRLPAFQKLARTLERHLEGILNYCRHKVPFGTIEAINGNIRSMIRRGRGYRDHEYLILEVQKSTAQARLRRAA
jgi:hypothetical protein